MKYVGSLIASIGVFIVILVNLYYNSVTLDIQTIKNYVVETNLILEDVINKEDYVISKKDEYISRLKSLKSGMDNSKTTFLIKDYKEYKIKSIDSLIQSITEENNKDKHLEDVNKFNELGDKLLDKIVNKNIVEVTYLIAETYI